MAANLPRSVFLKRESLPFVLISRVRALYKVAEGVLPPGLVQSFLAAIASISSLQVIACFVSINTLAAASMALSFLAFALPLPLVALGEAFFFGVAFLVAAFALEAFFAIVVFFVVVLVAMIGLLVKIGCDGWAAIIRRREPPATTPGRAFRR